MPREPAAEARVAQCASAPARPPRFAPSPDPTLVMKKLISFSCELIVLNVAAAEIAIAEANISFLFIVLLLDCKVYYSIALTS